LLLLLSAAGESPSRMREKYTDAMTDVKSAEAVIQLQKIA